MKRTITLLFACGLAWSQASQEMTPEQKAEVARKVKESADKRNALIERLGNLEQSIEQRCTEIFRTLENKKLAEATFGEMTDAFACLDTWKTIRRQNKP